MNNLKGKKALITGASRGIGHAIALALGSHGAEIFGTATSEKGIENIKNTLSASGISGTGLMLDLTSSESLEKLETELKERNALPDILINNAGITRDGLLLRMSEEDWDLVIETNLKSIYRLCKICARAMNKTKWGRIVNITSVSGLMGNPGQCNYAAAKAGIIGFTKSLAREIASRGVTVNCVAPGFIDTDMTNTLPDKLRHELTQQIPLGRFGTPTEVAHSVLMLVDENASYITGETICVTGGLYMK